MYQNIAIEKPQKNREIFVAEQGGGQWLQWSMTLVGHHFSQTLRLFELEKIHDFGRTMTLVGRNRGKSQNAFSLWRRRRRFLHIYVFWFRKILWLLLVGQ